MELAGRSDHYAGGGEEERYKQADAQIEAGQTAMFASPALSEHGVGEEEGHVNAYSRGRGCHHAVPLRAENGFIPISGIAGISDDLLKLIGRLREQ